MIKAAQNVTIIGTTQTICSIAQLTRPTLSTKLMTAATFLGSKINGLPEDNDGSQGDAG